MPSRTRLLAGLALPLVLPLLPAPSAQARSRRELPPMTRVASRVPGDSAPRTASPSSPVYQPAPRTVYWREEAGGGGGVERQILALVAAERSRRGLPALADDSLLAEATRRHSRNMAQAGFFDRYAPTGGLRTPTDRYRAVAGSRDTPRIGENIYRSSAVGSSAAQRAHSAFMRSPGHRENVLRRDYRRIGIGVHVGADGQCWVTQMFSD